MDATCAIQASIHVFSLVRKYVSRILGTYQIFVLYQKNGRKHRKARLSPGLCLQSDIAVMAATFFFFLRSFPT